MRAVLLTIADAANRDGEHAHPGIEAMVEGSLYQRSTVFATLRRLTAEGWLEVEQEGRGRGHATVYRLPGVAVQSPDLSATGKGPTAPDLLAGGKGPVRPDVSDEKRSSLAPEKVQSGAAAPITPTVGNSVTPTRRADDFDEFWRLYPRSTGKGAAKAAFVKALRKTTLQALLEAAWRFAHDPNLPEPQFIPHPATWLNQERWEDGALPPRTDGRRPSPSDRTAANLDEIMGGENGRGGPRGSDAHGAERGLSSRNR